MSADIQIDRDNLPYRCPECVSEDVMFSGARSDLVCGNCGEEFDREEAVVIVGELEAQSTYTVALLHTYEFGPDAVKVKARDTWHAARMALASVVEVDNQVDDDADDAESYSGWIVVAIFEGDCVEAEYSA